MPVCGAGEPGTRLGSASQTERREGLAQESTCATGGWEKAGAELPERRDRPLRLRPLGPGVPRVPGGRRRSPHGSASPL